MEVMERMYLMTLIRKTMQSLVVATQVATTQAVATQVATQVVTTPVATVATAKPNRAVVLSYPSVPASRLVATDMVGRDEQVQTGLHPGLGREVANPGRDQRM